MKQEYYYQNPLCHYRTLELVMGKQFSIIEPVGPGCTSGCPLCFANRSRDDEILVSGDCFENLTDKMFINETTESTIPEREEEVSSFYKRLPGKRNVLNVISRFPNSLRKTLAISDVQRFDMVIVQIAYTGFNDDYSRKWEPMKETASQRLRGIKNLIDDGYEVSVRFEPLYPKYHTREDVLDVLESLYRIGICHLTTETLKLTPKTLPIVENIDKTLLDYFDLELFCGEYYPKQEIRDEMLGWVVESAKDKGIDVGLCLECNSNCKISSRVRTNAFCEGISRSVIHKMKLLRRMERK